MKTIVTTGLIACAAVVGLMQSTSARSVKFKHVISAYADDAGVGLNAPEGVACGSQGDIVVADTGNDRLVRFMFKDGEIKAGSVIKVDQLTAPSRVALTPRGDIFAVDDRQRRVAHVNADGTFKETVRFDGIPAPSTVVPKAIATDSAGRLYVLDAFGGRVLVIDVQGVFQRAIAMPADVGFVADITVDESGDLYALDAIKRRLLIAKTDAKAFIMLDKDLSDMVPTIPTSLLASRGSLFLLEGNGGRIINVAKDGAFLTRQLAQGWDEGALNHPAQMCINDQDFAFIADRDNRRVSVFQVMR
jgi:sugar lactone lactonase YvrE